MTKKAKKPEIRFAGFTDEWEEKKLGDEAIELVAGGDIDKTLLCENGNYPVIANALTLDGIVGYYQNEYRIKAPAVTITGRGDIGHAKARTINFTPVVRLLSIRSKHDVFFLENAINTLDIMVESTGVPQLTVPQLAQYDIKFPPTIDEEKDLGELFTALDRLITIQQRKLEKLLNVKKSMLDKMFPKAGSRVPEIRFAGFTGDWDIRKLEDYLVVSDEKNIENEFTRNDVFSVSGEFGIVNQIEFQGRSFAGVVIDNYGIVKTGDVVYTKSPLKANPYGIIKTNKLKTGIVSVLYAVYHPLNNCNSNFVQTYFEKDDRLNNYLRPLISKGAKNTINISDEMALNGEVIFPSFEEQSAISHLFFHLDRLITLQQRKLEKLQNVKKAMLEKMFV